MTSDDDDDEIDTTGWEDELEKEVRQALQLEEIQNTNIYDLFTKALIDIEEKKEYIEKVRTAKKILYAIEDTHPTDLVIISMDSGKGFAVTSTFKSLKDVTFLIDQAKKRLLEV